VKAQTLKISQIAVSFGPPGLHRVFINFDPSTPLTFAGSSINLTLAGLTTRAGLNGGPFNVVVNSSLQIEFLASFASSGAITGFVAETGTATTGTGITGGLLPVWQTTVGSVTQDNTQQWLCKGSALQNWGFAAPTQIPAVTQAPFPTSVPAWQANTFYAPLFVIQDAGVYYKLTTDGTTGGGAPAFDPVVGHTTADGSAVWTSLGAAAWAASTAYATGADGGLQLHLFSHVHHIRL
jgi:hypothetical protein